MAVKIRLSRRGRKKLALYDVVVADARAPRDGKFIEKIGTYNPATVPASIVLDENKAFDWLMKGAQPSDTVRAMLSYRGVTLRRHLQIGVIKGAITQEQADAKLAEWLKSKESKIQSKIEGLASAKQSAAKARKDAEIKVKEARAEAIRKKAIVVEAAPAEAPAAEETPAEPQA
jgi:small subunit ribosomal protein S16